MKTYKVRKGFYAEPMPEPINYALEHKRHILNNALSAYNRIQSGNIITPNQRREDANKRLLLAIFPILKRRN